jgi:hypothetical protein
MGEEIEQQPGAPLSEEAKQKLLDLGTEVSRLKAELVAKENELAAVYQHNAALQEEIEKLTGPAAATNPSGDLSYRTDGFELDGEKFGFNYPQTRHKGRFISHLEIMAEETLQRLLISIGAGIIKKIK